MFDFCLDGTRTVNYSIAELVESWSPWQPVSKIESWHAIFIKENNCKSWDTFFCLGISFPLTLGWQWISGIVSVFFFRCTENSSTPNRPSGESPGASRQASQNAMDVQQVQSSSLPTAEHRQFKRGAISFFFFPPKWQWRWNICKVLGVQDFFWQWPNWLYLHSREVGERRHFFFQNSTWNWCLERLFELHEVKVVNRICKSEAFSVTHSPLFCYLNQEKYGEQLTTPGDRVCVSIVFPRFLKKRFAKKRPGGVGFFCFPTFYLRTKKKRVFGS